MEAPQRKSFGKGLCCFFTVYHTFSHKIWQLLLFLLYKLPAAKSRPDRSFSNSEKTEKRHLPRRLTPPLSCFDPLQTEGTLAQSCQPVIQLMQPGRGKRLSCGYGSGNLPPQPSNLPPVVLYQQHPNPVVFSLCHDLPAFLSGRSRSWDAVSESLSIQTPETVLSFRST